MTRDTTHKVSLGTISHGTLRNEDLISAFESELQYLDSSESSPLAAIIARYRDGSGDAMPSEDDNPVAWEEWYETESASEYINDLADALNDMAPVFCYFGSLEGDGSDFGFWPMDIKEVKDDEDVTVTNDLGKVGQVATPYVLVINDHGNCTLYHIDPDDNTNLAEVWSIV